MKIDSYSASSAIKLVHEKAERLQAEIDRLRRIECFINKDRSLSQIRIMGILSGYQDSIEVSSSVKESEELMKNVMDNIVEGAINVREKLQKDLDELLFNAPQEIMKKLFREN